MIASLLALAAGLILGTITHAAPSAPLEILRAVVEPLGYLWLNALQMTVIPLVAATLISALVRSGNAAEIGVLSVTSMVLFFLFLGTAGLVTITVVPLILSAFPMDTASASVLGALSTQAQAAAERTAAPSSLSLWIVGLFPRNPFAAFADGDLLPVLTFTILFGLALSRTEPANRKTAASFFLAVAEAMMILVRWILVFTPFGVFALAMAMGSSLGGDIAGLVGRYLVLECGLLLFLTLLLYPATLLAGGVSMRRFAQGVLPAQVVALGTRSSMASLPALLSGAERRLQVDPEVARLGLPLAVSTFKLSSPIAHAVKFLLITHLFGIDLGAVQIFAFMTTVILLSFSIPGLPLGGGPTRMLPAYLAAGAPIEALILFEAVEAIPDIFKTVLNVTADMSVALILNRVARRFFSAERA